MPPHMLGVVMRATGNTITQLAQEYLNYTLSTWLEMWEQRIPFTFDLDTDELFIEFNVDRLLRADIATRFAANRWALGGAGWRTVNQVRAEEGQAQVQAQDTLSLPLNPFPI